MDLMQALAELKSLAMRRIAEAARQGDVRPIRAIGELAAAIESDLRLVREIAARRVRYEREMAGLGATAEPARAAGTSGVAARPAERARPLPDASLEGLDPAQYGLEPIPEPAAGGEPGSDPRAAFLEAVAKAGCRLEPISRTLYRTPGGKSVAVPVASETRAGRWLLAVEDMTYDFVAMLCQRADGDLRAFVVPRRALEPIWKGLGRNGRQVKMNVVHREGGWWLQVPGTEPLSLAPFLEAFSALQ